MFKKTPLLLTALALLLGAQLMRVFGPSLSWYLRDTVRVGTMTLAPIALGPFLLGLLAPLPARWLGPRGAWALAGAGLIAARLVEQLSTRPDVDLVASLLGLVFFLWLWPLLLGRDRHAFVAGVILGLGADVAVKALFASLDLSWMGGTMGAVGTLVLLLATGVLLVALGRETWTPTYPAAALPLFFVGPLILLHWMVLHNQGWVSTLTQGASLTGWSPALATLFILAGDLAALWWLSRPPALPGPRLWVTLGPGALLLLVSLTVDQPGTVFIVAGFVGLVVTGPYLAQLVRPAPTGGEPPGRPGRAMLALGLGNLTLVLVMLLYYLSLEIALPVRQPEIRISLGVLLFLGGLASLRAAPAPLPAALRAPRFAAGLLLVPLALLARDLLAGSPEPPPATGFPVRVMTYNIHSGFSTEGRHNPATIAAVIEAADVDVIGFQEISRGVIIDGGTDLLAWFSRRLDMPYFTFFGTTDPVWGNAILSRYPLSAVETTRLPRYDTRIGRGLVAARVSFGTDDLLFMSTHLHHRHENLEGVHIGQLESILTLWAGRPRTALVGDMNAHPGWRQMELVLANGFLDSWREAGEGPGFTSNAADPRQRIDWVFHTVDLIASEASVPVSQASDHFPVVVTLERLR